MDCDYDPTQVEESKFKKQTRSSRRKGHKKSKFNELVDTKKPVFNAAEKTFQQYLDEYYSLDFEDVIGDMPTRYKYRKVAPNSFGLSVEEVCYFASHCRFDLPLKAVFSFSYALDFSC